ncbi:MAG: TetR/AcrR family transcriptional regulator [Flavobacteriaceae bacterium]
MQHLSINLTVHEKLYLKDPLSSDLGKKIVKHGVAMIESLGFEEFTFKKLGAEIQSNESSIYRYFESKHQLLLYLINWYWSWMEYQIVFSTSSMTDAPLKLNTAIALLTQKWPDNSLVAGINAAQLQRVIITEAPKAMHTKSIDKENEEGLFGVYKRVIQRVSDMVMDINPKYAYPHMLITTVVEGAHQMRFFADHLPTITDQVDNQAPFVESFYQDLIQKTIIR